MRPGSPTHSAAAPPPPPMIPSLSHQNPMPHEQQRPQDPRGNPSSTASQALPFHQHGNSATIPTILEEAPPPQSLASPGAAGTADDVAVPNETSASDPPASSSSIYATATMGRGSDVFSTVGSSHHSHRQGNLDLLQLHEQQNHLDGGSPATAAAAGIGLSTELRRVLDMSTSLHAPDSVLHRSSPSVGDGGASAAIPAATSPGPLLLHPPDTATATRNRSEQQVRYHFLALIGNGLSRLLFSRCGCG